MSSRVPDLRNSMSSSQSKNSSGSALVSDAEDDSFVSRRTPSRRPSSIFSLDTTPLEPPNEIDIKKFTSDDFHFSMIRNLHLADFITMLNGFSGFYSIVSCLRFTLTGKPHYVQRAHFFILLGMFFDFFDGRVARLRNRSSLMGQELDSLADLISFGVAPASIAFAIGFQSTLDVLFLSFFVLCGLARLARFNVTVAQVPKDTSGKSKFFEGLPIPTTLFLVAVMAFCVHKGYITENIPFGIYGASEWYEFHPAVLAFFIQGCGMISKSLKIPKP
ncbi:Cho1 [Kluyveromyces lactis]|nr:Cho1 [Kluyveromyces lactis]